MIRQGIREAQHDIHDGSVSARKRFGKYGKEQHKGQRGADVQGDILKRMFRGYLLEISANRSEHNTRTLPELAKEMARDLQYSPEDVENFTKGLSDLEAVKEFHLLPYFLHGLVEMGDAERYVFRTSGLNAPLNSLGVYNTKHLTLIGDAGSRVGSVNQGTIIIEGDAGDEAGAHNVGTIIIKGNAGRRVGNYMFKGLIHIHGDCESIASFNYGGIIRVDGEIRHPGIVNGAKVINKGKEVTFG
jgi:hypothetical protein